jgi:hypothetical protein
LVSPASGTMDVMDRVNQPAKDRWFDSPISSGVDDAYFGLGHQDPEDFALYVADVEWSFGYRKTSSVSNRDVASIQHLWASPYDEDGNFTISESRRPFYRKLTVCYPPR